MVNLWYIFENKIDDDIIEVNEQRLKTEILKTSLH